MKATDLMCGDLILVDKRPTRVYGVMERMGRVYDTMTNDISLKRCEPIPLSPEILEKNGFVPYEEDEESFHDENCVFLKQSLGGYGVCIDKNRTISGLFHYVHELQHALRLCGIEKEIEL